MGTNGRGVCAKLGGNVEKRRSSNNAKKCLKDEEEKKNS